MSSLHICLEQGKSLLGRIEAAEKSGSIHQGNEVWEYFGRLQSALGGLVEAVEDSQS